MINPFGYGAVAKGLDLDSCVVMPERTIKVIGGHYRRVLLDEIDMLNDPIVTKRKIIVEKAAPLTMAFLHFGIRLKNVYARGHKKEIAISSQYPQKHIVDVEIRGANGSTGFLPGGPMTSTIAKAMDVSDSHYLPITLSSLVNVHMKHGDREDDRYGDESSDLLRGGNSGWQISEHDWWNYVSQTSDASFDITQTDQFYTRGSDMMSTMVVMNGKSRELLNQYRYLNLLYSESNIVTIRVTMELESASQKKITFEKFAPSRLFLS